MIADPALAARCRGQVYNFFVFRNNGNGKRIINIRILVDKGHIASNVGNREGIISPRSSKDHLFAVKNLLIDDKYVTFMLGWHVKDNGVSFFGLA